MKPGFISMGLAALTAVGGIPAATAQDSGQYVSREEYEKLKRDFERMQALMQQMEKRLAQQAPAAAPQELAKVKEELKTVKQEAQEAKKQAKAALPGERKLLITGYGFAGLANSQQSDSSFNAGFNPIFLWKIRDDIFFEGEAEFELEDGSTNVGLEFAQILEQELEQARTPADHQALAGRYEREAERLLQRLAERHERLAETYARTDNPKMAGDSARHCRNIARRLREAAGEMQSLA